MKRRLRSIKARYPGLGFWWPAFVFILLLCLAIILKLPNVQDMAIVALVAVTMMYVIITQGMLNEMRQKRLYASQPVLWPMIWGWDGYKIMVIFENIGNGPALDIDIYLGRGKDLVISECEHKRYSYLVAGATKTHDFLEHTSRLGPLGEAPLDSNVISKLVGKYTLLVEWHDLYKSGPFFQAILPFSLDIGSDGRLYATEGEVVINHIPKKR